MNEIEFVDNEHDFTDINWTYERLIKEIKLSLDRLDKTDKADMFHKMAQVGGFSNSELKEVLNTGPYITSGESIACTEKINNWTNNIPTFAYVGLPGNKKGEITFYFIELINKLPPMIAATGRGYGYVIHTIFFENKKMDQDLYHVTIDEHGNVYPCCMLSTRMINGIPNRQWRPELPQEKGKLTTSQIVSWMMNTWQTRHFYPNIIATRGKSKISLVFDIPSMKEIFKERRMERTRYGRRKPIIHWVSSHYRVVKEKRKWWQKLMFWRKYEKISNVKTHIRGAKEFYVENIKINVFIPTAKEQNQMAKYQWAIDGEKVNGYDNCKPNYYPTRLIH